MHELHIAFCTLSIMLGKRTSPHSHCPEDAQVPDVGFRFAAPHRHWSDSLQRSSPSAAQNAALKERALGSRQTLRPTGCFSWGSTPSLVLAIQTTRAADQDCKENGLNKVAF